MKTIFKVVGIGLIFYAITLSTNDQVTQAIKQETDSLWHYYNISPEEMKAIQEDLEFEGIKRKPKAKIEKKGEGND